MRPRDTQLGELMDARMMQLLSGVSVAGDRHLAEIERDLVQMDVLLDEAIKKLCASFMAIHRAVGLQQETLDRVLSAGAAAPDCAARLGALRDEIGLHVDAAVTGLQFQDMTSQLIGRMARHLAGLRDVFDAFDAEGAALPETADAPLLARLALISDRAGARCTDVAGVARSTVNQRHMESGDIELF
jgi:hypothetical protein